MKYKLDATGFDYSKHFLFEGELFGSGAVLLTFLTLPVSITILLIRVLTFGKVDFTKTQLLPEWNRQTIEMTFGDMLTWYIIGEYSLQAGIRFQLTNAV